MTWTAAADAVVPACPRAAAACPASPHIAAARPAAARAGVLCTATAVTGPTPGRPGTAQRAASELAGALRQRKVMYVLPLHRHLLRGDAATLAGWPSDPGRDVLCLLTSPPRWPRSP
jgi:hypothetical protein